MGSPSAGTHAKVAPEGHICLAHLRHPAAPSMAWMEWLAATRMRSILPVRVLCCSPCLWLVAHCCALPRCTHGPPPFVWAPLLQVCHAPGLLLEGKARLVGRFRFIAHVLRGTPHWAKQWSKLYPAQRADCMLVTPVTLSRLEFLIATSQVHGLGVIATSQVHKQGSQHCLWAGQGVGAYIREPGRKQGSRHCLWVGAIAASQVHKMGVKAARASSCLERPSLGEPVNGDAGWVRCSGWLLCHARVTLKHLMRMEAWIRGVGGTPTQPVCQCLACRSMQSAF